MALSTKIGIGLGLCTLALCSGCSGLIKSDEKRWNIGLNITPNELGGCFVTFDVGSDHDIDDQDFSINPSN